MSRFKNSPSARTIFLSIGGFVVAAVVVTAVSQMNGNSSSNPSSGDRDSKSVPAEASKVVLGGLILSPVEGVPVVVDAGAIRAAVGPSAAGAKPAASTPPASPPAAATTSVAPTAGQAGSKGADGRSESSGSDRTQTTAPMVPPPTSPPPPPPPGGLLDLLDTLLP